MELTKELAEAAAKRFIESGAANYTGDVFTVTREDGQPAFEVLVTIQKAGAKSPQDRVTELVPLLRKAAKALINRRDYDTAAEINKALE